MKGTEKTGEGRKRVSQRQSHGCVKRGWPEWQPVFRDHRRDRMTDRLIEAVPLHHIANSDPRSVTPVTILFLWPTVKSKPQFVWGASQKSHIDQIKTEKMLHAGETYLK